MSIYKKLSEARVKLQGVSMKKSGLNKFAGYQYFELGDFMPHINQIFNDVGLCGVVSFFDSGAQLDIYDTDSDGKISFCSPVADATVKGATPIQCLGSQHTYLRRYLWMLALEIVEHDAIDAVKQEPANQPDYAGQIAKAASMADLVNVWQAIPKSLHKQLTATKDARKKELAEVAA